MSYNKRKANKQAIAYLDQILSIHKKDSTALPAAAIGHVKSAKTILVKDRVMLNKSKEATDG